MGGDPLGLLLSVVEVHRGYSSMKGRGMLVLLLGWEVEGGVHTAPTGGGVVAVGRGGEGRLVVLLLKERLGGEVMLLGRRSVEETVTMLFKGRM